MTDQGDTSTAGSDEHGDTAGFAHVSVMLDEVVEVLADVPDGIVVDATLGGAGHAAALLAANDGISILGLDRDQMALSAAAARLADHDDRVALRHTRFDGLADAVRSLGVDRVSGALFDLGVSSPQLDLADRGFSFRNDGPL
ncbi:MAG: 16S rRNA (cytosine(1402)-N(4))-methyltransferase, partial [Myxococcota bacterium]